MKNHKKEVGQRIKNIRLENGDTLEEFGKRFNTSKVTVFNWEKGRNLPNKSNLKEIADLGNISIEELLHGNENEILKRNIIEMGKNNEYDLLDIFIVYLNKNNKFFSDFYTNKSYSYGSFKPVNSSEHEEMKKTIAIELFQSFIENEGVQTIKDKTQQSFFFFEDAKSLKREIAFMMHKYFDLIIFEDDETFEGTVMNTVNALKYDFPFVEIEQSNLEDYIKFQTDQNETINEAHSENFFKTLIELFFYKEAYNIVSPFRQELVNLLSDYDKAIDKYLNKDNK